MFAEEDFYNLIKKGEKSNIEINYVLQENIKAPLNKGDKVGKVIITDNNIVVKEIDIITIQDIKAKSFKDNFKDILENWTITK